MAFTPIRKEGGRGRHPLSGVSICRLPNNAMLSFGRDVAEAMGFKKGDEVALSVGTGRDKGRVLAYRADNGEHGYRLFRASPSAQALSLTLPARHFRKPKAGFRPKYEMGDESVVVHCPEIIAA